MACNDPRLNTSLRKIQASRRARFPLSAIVTLVHIRSASWLSCVHRGDGGVAASAQKIERGPEIASKG